MLLNIFVDDIIQVISNTCSLYDYADYNTLGFCHPATNILKTNCFDENHLKVNISTFQSIILRSMGVINDMGFCVLGFKLRPVSCVNLHGVKMHDRISFATIKAPRHWPLCGEFTGGK